MIPVRLSLKNFLSYGAEVEPVDFTQFRLACLSGRNGHGKSALLDAITWALWGQARVSAPDDLVRLHQTAMEVDFEFELEGQHYRVIRKRTRGRIGQSDLQLQLRDGSGSWKSLTAQGVRGTQDRITALLRMDYDTFVNSSFILQGRADDFARKTPGERKRILGEILNLNQYDVLAGKARALARERAGRCQALDPEIARLDEEARGESSLREAAARLECDSERARANVERLRADLNHSLTQKSALAASRRERDDLQRRLATALVELEQLRQAEGNADRRHAALRTLLERAPAIRGRCAALQGGRARLRALQETARAVRSLEQGCAALERQVQERERDLEVAIGLARGAAEQLVHRRAQLPEVERRIAEARRQTGALDALRETADGLQAELERLAGERAAAEAEAARLAQAIEVSAEKIGLLKAAAASCPVCESPLTAGGRHALGWKIRREREACEQARAEAMERARAAAAAIDATRARGQQLQRELRVGEGWRTRLAQAEHDLAQIQEALRDLPGSLASVEMLQKQLADGAATGAVRAELALRRAALARLAYDEDAHRAVDREVAALDGAEGDLQLLLGAERDAAAADEERLAAMAARATKEASIAADTASVAALDRVLAGADAVDRESARLSSELAIAEAEQREHERDLGRARAAVERCVEQARLLRDRKAERERVAREQATYAQLEQAFGRNGIQALIIENAIPEIEQEANAILARISSNEMRVGLRTQRETKAAGVAETLEIEISDSLGARRYELFSGGEAFRINFALRIALSKLLARRAGARLQTLVIDEGFGSQDAEGRERLVEAILAVQEEFARILVITHVDELKEFFPTWIEVTKTPAGSRITVV
jgi:exonuclease SbcC